MSAEGRFTPSARHAPESGAGMGRNLHVEKRTREGTVLFHYNLSGRLLSETTPPRAWSCATTSGMDASRSPRSTAGTRAGSEAPTAVYRSLAATAAPTGWVLFGLLDTTRLTGIDYQGNVIQWQLPTLSSPLRAKSPSLPRFARNSGSAPVRCWSGMNGTMKLSCGAQEDIHRWTSMLRFSPQVRPLPVRRSS